MMAQDTPRRRGCWKTGCFGCAILIGAPILLALVLAGVNLITREAPEPHEQSFEHPVVVSGVDNPTGGTADEPPRDPLPEGPLGTLVDGPEGRIDLDVAYCEIRIVPGTPGEPIRLEADYDAAKFELIESFDRQEDGAWTYRLDFGLRTSLWLNLFMQAENRLRLVIPPDVPFRLRGDVRFGGGELDFGGLHAREVVLDFRMGGGRIDFSEPLPEPMETFTLNARMGGGEIRRVGNASPRLTTVGSRMGGFDLDLGGRWVEDGDVRIRAGMGGIDIRSPRTANIVLGDRSVRMGGVEQLSGREPDPTLPTVTVHVDATMGGVNIR
jgi:hypothetical protein